MRPLALALLLAAALPAAGADRFRSDLAGAVAEARQRDVPIFVEVWAPW